MARRGGRGHTTVGSRARTPLRAVAPVGRMVAADARRARLDARRAADPEARAMDSPRVSMAPARPGLAPAVEEAVSPSADVAQRHWADTAVVLVVALVAAAASYGHMLHVELLAGEPLWLARAFPLTVDGLALAALRRGDAGRRWLALALAVSVAANVGAQFPSTPRRRARSCRPGPRWRCSARTGCCIDARSRMRPHPLTCSFAPIDGVVVGGHGLAIRRPHALPAMHGLSRLPILDH